ncbi:hypothetical protein QFZ37_000085 [Chryseobacterium ginsenosidimutans]|uniref:hypothetical protein n=1 Tax=Chryseobacterium ginsenosidimutans TaxID=687846 RepID=UPI0027859130|nr:hypothetical protein [Chryseobacterium ginsenosidimutans]MDQ0591716.1 hypothetical protein [Chryseobacterium ginsenosidimutans]
MKTYLAVLKKNINFQDLEKELKKKNIKLTAHYETIAVVKLESELLVFEKDFHDYFLSVEEDKDNLTI